MISNATITTDAATEYFKKGDVFSFTKDGTTERRKVIAVLPYVVTTRPLNWLERIIDKIRGYQHD